MKKIVWPLAVLASSLSISPGLVFAEALVPQVAQPAKVERKCLESELSNCPVDGLMHTVSAKPVGGKCPSMPVFGAARDADATRSTLLRLHIQDDGTVVLVETLGSSDNRDMDVQARSAAERCVFNAGTVNGKPSDTYLMMRYTRDAKATPGESIAQLNARIPKMQAVVIAPPPPKPRRRMEDMHCDKIQPKFPMAVVTDPNFQRATVVASIRLEAPTAKLVNVAIQRSSGFAALDQAVLEAFRDFRCNPDTPLDGDIEASQQFEFKLD